MSIGVKTVTIDPSSRVYSCKKFLDSSFFVAMTWPAAHEKSVITEAGFVEIIWGRLNEEKWSKTSRNWSMDE